MTTLVLKSIPKLPGSVLGTSPIVVTASGVNYTVSLNLVSLAALLPATTGANPTASVGLAAVNGSASTFLRSDGSPALSQAITPTWTGDHAWNGGKVTLMAGTAAKAPLNLQSGTVLTTPAAGAVEYDGTVAYFTHAANERGAIECFQWIRQAATYTLVSQTAAQQLFNASTNGAVTLAAGTYEFECQFDLSSMSASGGNFGFQIGGAATLTSIKWSSIAHKSAALDASAAGQYGQRSNSIQIANLVTASTTGTQGCATIKGIICISVGGTIIPQVILGVAAAAVVGINSFFKIWPIGTNVQTTLGNWS